jgi:hypothetical protein
MSEDFDIRDLMLDAQAEVQEIVREVVQDLLKPQMMAQIRQMWMAAPEDIKEQFKRERPEDYAALMDELKK